MRKLMYDLFDKDIKCGSVTTYNEAREWYDESHYHTIKPRLEEIEETVDEKEKEWRIKNIKKKNEKRKMAIK